MCFCFVLLATFMFAMLIFTSSGLFRSAVLLICLRLYDIDFNVFLVSPLLLAFSNVFIIRFSYLVFVVWGRRLVKVSAVDGNVCILVPDAS